MKTFMIIIVMALYLTPALSQSTRAELKGDTIYYKGSKFYKGEVLNLGFGSRADKNFAYITFNNKRQVTSYYAREQVLVKNVRVGGNTAYVIAEATKRNLVGRFKIAVDNAMDAEELMKP